MAKIYYALDGYGDDKSNEGRQVDFATTVSLLKGYNVRRLGATRTINGDRKADWSKGYKYVVLSVEQGEKAQQFPNPGLYLIEDLTPGQYEKLLG